MPVDLSAAIYAEYKRARKRAEEAERRGDRSEAAAAYRQCAELMRKYADYTHDAQIRQRRLERAQSHTQAAKLIESGHITGKAAKELIPGQ